MTARSCMILSTSSTVHSVCTATMPCAMGKISSSVGIAAASFSGSPCRNQSPQSPCDGRSPSHWSVSNVATASA